MENIVVRKARVGDVDNIQKIISEMADKGLMLTRSKYRVVTMLTNFFVAEFDGKFAGCGAFYPLWTDLGEVMSLAVAPCCQGKGVGKKLVETIVNEGRGLGFPAMITLTYQVDFFKKLGFKVTNKDKFPRKVWRECLECPKLENCDETAMVLNLRKEI